MTAGVYDMAFDLTNTGTYSAAFVALNGGSAAGAEAALRAAVIDGRAYLNIHTAAFGGGEIRGFFQPLAAAPEPATLLLFALGALGAGIATRRRKRA